MSTYPARSLNSVQLAVFRDSTSALLLSPFSSDFISAVVGFIAIISIWFFFLLFLC